MSSQDPPAAALAEIARQATEAQDEATTFLRQLVACETAVRSPVTPEFLAETRKCRSLVAGMLEGLGCEVHEWDTQDGYPTLAARLPGSGVGRSLTFNGHIDVVPVGDTSAWSHDPWAGEIVDGKLYGRGTADMKAGLVSMIYAAKSVLAAGYRPAGDVWFHVVSDEELVGYGTRDCIEKFPATAAVLDAEPTDLTVIPTEGGLEHLRIEIEGREAHAGSRWRNLAPGENGPGVNAVEKGVKLVTAIQDLERQWVNRKSHPLFPPGYNSLLPAIFIAGPGGGQDGQLNVVNNPGTMANYCAIEYNIWYYPDEPCEQVKADFEALRSRGLPDRRVAARTSSAVHLGPAPRDLPGFRDCTRPPLHRTPHAERATRRCAPGDQGILRRERPGLVRAARYARLPLRPRRHCPSA